MEQEIMHQSWGAPSPKPAPTPPITEPSEAEIIPQKSSLTRQIFKGVIVFVSTFIFIYLFLTFPALYAKLQYFFSHFGKEKEIKTIALPQELTTDNASDLFLSTVKEALEKSPDTKYKTKEPAKPKYSLDISDLENNYLIIPKIGVKVPIIWNSPPDEEIMMKNLQNGVVHYQGTGLPNEDTGNAFISGHSSYYWWDKGKYKTIFATLDKVDAGDELALAYENRVYIYKVYEKAVVKPEQVEVLQSTGESILSLMTCVPVGTNLKRLVVKSKRIDITTKKGEAISPSPSPSPTSTPTYTPTPSSSPIDNLNVLPWTQ